jgi:hypothetical protein
VNAWFSARKADLRPRIDAVRNLTMAGSWSLWYRAAKLNTQRRQSHASANRRLLQVVSWEIGPSF